MYRIKELHPLPGYRLHVEFADGVKGIVDLSHLVGKGIFTPWREPGSFERVRVGPSGEPRWDDELDVDPDSIYMKITGKGPEDVFPSLKSHTSQISRLP